MILAPVSEKRAAGLFPKNQRAYGDVKAQIDKLKACEVERGKVIEWGRSLLPCSNGNTHPKQGKHCLSKDECARGVIADLKAEIAA